jgi:hypothetical protein
MKLHALLLTTAGVLILKIVVGHQTPIEGMYLFGIAFLLFLVGGVMYSFNWDKEHGTTDTRDAFVLLMLKELYMNGSRIMLFIIAIFFTLWQVYGH